jgi:broad specificity phosphatase PhoE
MMRHILMAAAVVATLTGAAAAQSVFVVRHAERADTASAGPATMGSDPDLSDAGRARAQSLATLLKDARITAIYVTQYKRTQQTAAPLAASLGITPTVIPSNETAQLLTRLREASGNVLVVGHSNSVPDVVQGLGIADAPAIADHEYDNLFIVTQAKLIRLHFR